MGNLEIPMATLLRWEIDREQHHLSKKYVTKKGYILIKKLFTFPPIMRNIFLKSLTIFKTYSF